MTTMPRRCDSAKRVVETWGRMRCSCSIGGWAHHNINLEMHGNRKTNNKDDFKMNLQESGNPGWEQKRGAPKRDV